MQHNQEYMGNINSEYERSPLGSAEMFLSLVSPLTHKIKLCMQTFIIIYTYIYD